MCKGRVIYGAMVLFVILGMTGCKPSAEVPPKEAPAAPAASAQTVPSPAPVESSALVTFVSGEVEILRNSAWQPVGIGENLPQDSTIKVREKSYCELQFGNTAVVRISENTDVRLEQLVLQAEGSQVGVKLDSGSVLAKVSKLSGKDKFQIRTGVAVCGVRGTEFGVSAARDGKTVLKVKSGKVAVLPSTADVETIGKKVSQDEKTQAIVDDAVSQVVAQAPVVESNHEVVISAETVKKTENLLKYVQDQINSFVAVSPDNTAEKEKKINEFAVAVSAQVSKALEKPNVTTEKGKEELAPLDAMALLTLPKPLPVSAVAPKEEKKVNLLAVAIMTVPEDADILLDGVVVGRGDLKRLLEEGARVNFRIQRDGYEPKDLSIEVKTSSTLDFKVELVPKPRDLTILSEPADAEILVDGKSVGRGSYKGSFVPGKDVKIGVRKAGFEEKNMDLKVSFDTAPTIKIALGKVSKEVRIAVEPKDAAILIGTASAGTGRYQGIHNAGDKLSLRFKRSGFEEKTLTYEVKEKEENTIEVKLERIRKTLTVKAEPDDASVTVNGSPAGTGTYSNSFDYGTSLIVEIKKDGYLPKTLRLEVDEFLKSIYEVKLEREKKDIAVSVQPSSAVILLNGRAVGRGTYQGRHDIGESVSFAFQDDGYGEKALKVDVSASTPAAYSVELEANPVYLRFKATQAKIVGLVAADDGRLFVGSDSSGKIFCSSRDGRSLWTIATSNTPNENSEPIVAGSTVYFSGAKEFLIVDLGKGTVLLRQNLDAASANLFGRRVVAAPDGILFPTDTSLLVKDPATGENRNTFKLAGNCMTTPSLYKDRIVIADQLGKVHVLSASSGQTVTVIETGALQPVAGAIQVLGSVGYFSGRRGNVVAVDFEKNSVLWQAKLTQDSSSAVFQDLAVSDSGVFAFSKGIIYGLDPMTGKPLFEPIKNVSSPPLLMKKTLYYGTTEGKFVQATLQGRTEKSLVLNARVNSCPKSFRDGYVLFGTDGGELVIANPRGIK